MVDGVDAINGGISVWSSVPGARMIRRALPLLILCLLVGNGYAQGPMCRQLPNGQWSCGPQGAPSPWRPTQPTPQPRLEDQVKPIRQYGPPSIVRICHVAGGYYSYGSGTIVEDDGERAIVLTCEHTFDEGNGTTFVYGSWGMAKSTERWSDKHGADVSALIIPSPGCKTVDIADSEQFEYLTIAGYGPNGVYREARGSRQPQYSHLTVAAGAREGDSGGPMLNPDGDLHAVCIRTDGSITIGTPLYAIRSFLQRVRDRIGFRRREQPETKPILPGPGPEQPQPETAPEQRLEAAEWFRKLDKHYLQGLGLLPGDPPKKVQAKPIVPVQPIDDDWREEIEAARKKQEQREAEIASQLAKLQGVADELKAMRDQLADDTPDPPIPDAPEGKPDRVQGDSPGTQESSGGDGIWSAAGALFHAWAPRALAAAGIAVPPVGGSVLAVWGAWSALKWLRRRRPIWQAPPIWHAPPLRTEPVPEPPPVSQPAAKPAKPVVRPSEPTAQPAETSRPLFIGWDDEEQPETRNRYVRVEQSDLWGEAYRRAIARFAESNQTWAGGLKLVEKAAEQIHHGLQVKRRSEQSSIDNPLIVPQEN